jgi:hypothetical protein
MLMLSLVRTLAVTIPWMLNLAIGMLARSLQLPEPMVHDAVLSCSHRCRRSKTGSARRSARNGWHIGSGRGSNPQSNADHQPPQVNTKGELR